MEQRVRWALNPLTEETTELQVPFTNSMLTVVFASSYSSSEALNVLCKQLLGYCSARGLLC